MILLLAMLASAVEPTGPTCAGPLPVGLDAPRPELSGPVQTLDVDPLFRMHFTDEGEDAVSDELVDWAAAEWTELRAHVEDSPWRSFVGDDGTGGSSALDAYFVDIEANGYANGITAPEGEDGYACFIRLNPDIERLGEVVARSIVRHELVHCLQYRYTADAHSWLYESSATYEQYRPAPAETSLRLLTNALWAERITQPERPMNDLGEGLVQFEYAGFIWFKHLEEQGHAPWAVWEALEAEPNWRRGLDTLTGSLPIALLRHAWANQHVCGREGGVVTYAPDQAGCTAPVEAPRTVVDADSVEIAPLAPWSTVAFEVPRPAGEAPVQLSVSCEPTAGVLAVGVDDGADNFVSEGEADAGAAGGVAPGGAALVVVAAFGTEPASGSCTLGWVPAPVPAPEGGGGCSAAPDVAGLWWLSGLLILVRRRREER